MQKFIIPLKNPDTKLHLKSTLRYFENSAIQHACHRKTILCDCGYFWLKIFSLIRVSPFHGGFHRRSSFIVNSMCRLPCVQFNSKLHAISVAGVLRLKENSTRMNRHTPPGTQRLVLEKCFNLQRMEMKGLIGVYWMWILMCFALVGNTVGVGWTYFQLMVTAAACDMLI